MNKEEKKPTQTTQIRCGAGASWCSHFGVSVWRLSSDARVMRLQVCFMRNTRSRIHEQQSYSAGDWRGGELLLRSLGCLVVFSGVARISAWSSTVTRHWYLAIDLSKAEQQFFTLRIDSWEGAAFVGWFWTSEKVFFDQKQYWSKVILHW